MHSPLPPWGRWEGKVRQQVWLGAWTRYYSLSSLPAPPNQCFSPPGGFMEDTSRSRLRAALWYLPRGPRSLRLPGSQSSPDPLSQEGENCLQFLSILTFYYKRIWEEGDKPC